MKRSWSLFLLCLLVVLPLVEATIPCTGMGSQASCYDLEQNLQDTSGNHYATGTLGAGLNYSLFAPVNTYAGYFTNASARMTFVGNASEMAKIQNKAFVIGTWLRVNSSTTSNRIFEYDVTAGGGEEYYLFYNATAGTMTFSTVSGVCSITTLTSFVDGRWHRLVLTRDAVATNATLFLYVDGVLEGSSATCGSLGASSTGNFYLGGFIGGSVTAFPHWQDQFVMVNNTLWSGARVLDDYIAGLLIIDVNDEAT